MSSRMKAIVTPSLMRWAREQAGLSISEAAGKIKRHPDDDEISGLLYLFAECDYLENTVAEEPDYNSTINFYRNIRRFQYVCSISCIIKLIINKVCAIPNCKCLPFFTI